MSDELRDVDLRIAEFVFGWIRVKGTETEPLAHKRPDGHVVHPYSAPDYSKSVAHAMEVVEKMWERGWQLETSNGYKPHTLVADNLCSWWVRFINNENDMDNWSAEADTWPEAICRAAIRAISQTSKVPVCNEARGL